MRFILQDQQGRPLEQAVEHRLRKVLDCLQRTGPTIRDALLHTTRNHFRTIYPGSKHYDPDKVQPLEAKSGTVAEGSIDIDVPGVTRAYHDMDIRPKFREWLTIPIHREAYGKKAADFSNLFQVKKKDGRRFLVEKDAAGQLVFLFKLQKRVFQRQDDRLMPSDENFGDNICARVSAYLDREAKKA